MQNECGSGSVFLRHVEEYKMRHIGRSWIASIVLGLVALLLATGAWFALRRYGGRNIRSMDYSEAAVKVGALRNQLDFIYDSMHHRLPVSLKELESMGLASNWEKNAEKLEWECQIFPLTPDSSLLNCDSWQRPDESQLNAMVHSFDPRTGRFYKVHGHVLMFIPPPTSGIPLLANTQN
jgi:hypothetical protein